MESISNVETYKYILIVFDKIPFNQFFSFFSFPYINNNNHKTNYQLTKS